MLFHFIKQLIMAVAMIMIMRDKIRVVDNARYIQD